MIAAVYLIVGFYARVVLGPGALCALPLLEPSPPCHQSDLSNAAGFTALVTSKNDLAKIKEYTSQSSAAIMLMERSRPTLRRLQVGAMVGSRPRGRELADELAALMAQTKQAVQ